jgi:hypothetical protein
LIRCRRSSRFDANELASRLTNLAVQYNVALLVVVEDSGPVARRGRPRDRAELMAARISSVARSVWSIVRDADDRHRRMLLPVKTNLCGIPEGLGYVIKDGRIEWELEPVPLTVNDYVGESAERSPRRPPGPPAVVVEQAVQWLEELLSGHQVASNELYTRAKNEMGFTYGSVVRALDKLGCSAKYDAGKRQWYRELPASEASQPSAEKVEQWSPGAPGHTCRS